MTFKKCFDEIIAQTTALASLCHVDHFFWLSLNAFEINAIGTSSSSFACECTNLVPEASVVRSQYKSEKICATFNFCRKSSYSFVHLHLVSFRSLFRGSAFSQYPLIYPL
eukprot:GHVP01017767.1.p1 GENE.GHVP01017767.1~~GHVP01017767.1.p1  ORF type:complete len:110 (-),score=13.37 GHVP01017767.1:110-439(-)